MIYLASPYTHPDKAVMQSRYESAMLACHEFLKTHRFVYSPIVHCHELAQRHDLPTCAKFWRDYNYHMLTRADALTILTLPEWRQSKGCFAEASFWAATRHEPYITCYSLLDGFRITHNAWALVDMFEDAAKK